MSTPSTFLLTHEAHEYFAEPPERASAGASLAAESIAECAELREIVHVTDLNRRGPVVVPLGAGEITQRLHGQLFTSRHCVTCGGPFTARIRDGGAWVASFCSRPCYRRWHTLKLQARRRPCAACGRTFIPRQTEEHCSKRCGNISRDAFVTKYRARDGQWIHRQVAEKALGKPLPAGAEVHHVDGNKRNNANRNLVICQDSSYHKLLHQRTRIIRAGGHPDTHRICAVCKRAVTEDEMGRNTTRCKPCGRAYWRKWQESKAIQREPVPGEVSPLALVELSELVMTPEQLEESRRFANQVRHVLK